MNFLLLNEPSQYFYTFDINIFNFDFPLFAFNFLISSIRFPKIGRFSF